MSVQQRFTQVVHRFERLRAQQREVLRQAEHLFQTLLRQTFQVEVGERGEVYRMAEKNVTLPEVLAQDWNHA